MTHTTITREEWRSLSVPDRERRLRALGFSRALAASLAAAPLDPLPAPAVPHEIVKALGAALAGAAR